MNAVSTIDIVRRVWAGNVMTWLDAMDNGTARSVEGPTPSRYVRWVVYKVNK